MANWKHKVQFKHLLTEDKSPEAILKAMNGMADILEKNPIFNDFSEHYDFRGIDELACANELIESLYDYCDFERIWLE